MRSIEVSNRNRSLPRQSFPGSALLARFVLGLGSLLIPVDGVVAQETSSLRDRFLKEAPPAWKAYDAFVNRLQGRVDIKSTIRGKTSETYGEIRQNPNCQLFLYQHVRNSGKMKDEYGELTAFNPQYSFSLRRRTQQAPWSLTEVVLNATDQVSRPYFETQDGISLIRALVVLERTKLADLVTQPTFRVLEAKPVMWDSRDCVKIQFDNTHPVKKGKGIEPFIPEQRGAMILDPLRSWSVCSAELQCGYFGDTGPEEVQVRIATVMRDGKAGHPVPVRRTVENPNILVVFNFKLEEPAQLPSDDEFRLSAFDLPEPLGVTWSKPTPWYLWVSLAGALCLVAAGVFYWLKRRAAAGAH